MGVTGERSHAPIRDSNSDEHDGDRDRCAEACAPGVIEANISDAIKAVVEGDEQERDVDRDEPVVLEESALDYFEREPGGGADFGSEVLDPEVHDEQHEQGGACNALQKPIDRSSRHESVPDLSHAKALTRKEGIRTTTTQRARR